MPDDDKDYWRKRAKRIRDQREAWDALFGPGTQWELLDIGPSEEVKDAFGPGGPPNPAKFAADFYVSMFGGLPAHRYTAYLPGIGFRTLTSIGCVDYDLGRALYYHRPETPPNDFRQGFQTPQGPQMVQRFACPDPADVYAHYLKQLKE